MGRFTSSSVDEHLLADIVIRADALSGEYRAFEDEPVKVEVTLNGQQFTGSTVQYTYIAPSRVSAFSPTSGPVSGDTAIVVHGARFQGGLTYVCRFGTSTVNATYVDDGELACTSPANVFGLAPLEISVDASNFTSDSVMFSYYTEPEVVALAPTGGPILPGQTFVAVYGPTFIGGSDYRCKFGPDATGIVRAVLGGDGNLTHIARAVVGG